MSAAHRDEMINAQEALQRLKEGNARFVSGARKSDISLGPSRRSELASGALASDALASGQSPFAVVLGCSDSRVPVEIVFDQGAGDLFVIRVAGNIVAPSQIGSVEFAIEQFNTRLIVVLGHTGCGAVTAALAQMQHPTPPGGTSPRAIHSIVDRIRPAIQELFATELRKDPEALLRQSVRANIRASAAHLRYGSQIIEQQCERDSLLVVGAEYSLETGRIEFLDDSPPSAV